MKIALAESARLKEDPPRFFTLRIRPIRPVASLPSGPVEATGVARVGAVRSDRLFAYGFDVKPPFYSVDLCLTHRLPPELGRYACQAGV